MELRPGRVLAGIGEQWRGWSDDELEAFDPERWTR